MDILEKLYSLKDEKYAAFQSKLVPTIPAEKFIGVRVPVLRQLAKKLSGTKEAEAFMSDLPHSYYDENMLHGLLIGEMKEFDHAITETEKFLPHIDNWAVCDTMSPKIFKDHKIELLSKIRKWSASPLPYTSRFGMEMLMTHFLDDDFKPEYLEIPASVKSKEYYVNMMIAWFFATALAKQWDAAIPYIENRRLNIWVHSKTIQKSCESRRITDEQKAYLKTLKL